MVAPGVDGGVASVSGGVVSVGVGGGVAAVEGGVVAPAVAVLGGGRKALGLAVVGSERMLIQREIFLPWEYVYIFRKIFTIISHRFFIFRLKSNKKSFSLLSLDLIGDR